MAKGNTELTIVATEATDNLDFAKGKRTSMFDQIAEKMVGLAPGKSLVLSPRSGLTAAQMRPTLYAYIRRHELQPNAGGSLRVRVDTQGRVIVSNIPDGSAPAKKAATKAPAKKSPSKSAKPKSAKKATKSAKPRKTVKSRASAAVAATETPVDPSAE